MITTEKLVEPGAPIAPARPKRPPKQMPWVIPAYCEGCGDCVNRCPQGMLKMTETNVPGVFVPWVDEPEYCLGCGKCATGCVMGALQMTTYVEEALERFEKVRPRISQ